MNRKKGGGNLKNASLKEVRKSHSPHLHLALSRTSTCQLQFLLAEKQRKNREKIKNKKYNHLAIKKLSA